MQYTVVGRSVESASEVYDQITTKIDSLLVALLNSLALCMSPVIYQHGQLTSDSEVQCIGILTAIQIVVII